MDRDESSAEAAQAVALDDVVSVALGRTTVVGRVVFVDPEGCFRVDDGRGRAWSVDPRTTPVRRATPRQRRLDLARHHAYEARRLREHLHREIEGRGPLRMLVPGRYRDGEVVELATPLGRKWFLTKRAPLPSRQREWRRIDEQLRQHRDEANHYGATVALPPVGSWAPTQPELVAWESLAREGLLDPDERAVLEVVAAFWREHPDAAHGIVAADATLRPYRRARA